MAELVITCMYIEGHVDVTIRDGRLEAQRSKECPQGPQLECVVSGAKVTVRTIEHADEGVAYGTLADETANYAINLNFIELNGQGRCIIHDSAAFECGRVVMFICRGGSVTRVIGPQRNICIPHVKIVTHDRGRFLTRGVKLCVRDLDAILEGTSAVMGIEVECVANITARGSTICRIEASRACKQHIQHETLARVIIDSIPNESQHERETKKHKKAQQARERRQQRKRTAQEVTQAAVEAGIFSSNNNRAGVFAAWFEPNKRPRIDSPTTATSPIVVSDDEDGKPKAGPKSGFCALCFENPIRTFCMPCGHASMCPDCATEILTRKMSCPICRSKIRGISDIRFAT